MKFNETRVAGVFEVHPELKIDERGFFARTWCRNEFADRGLNPNLAQCSTSYNKRQGTLRGMHYQAKPFYEAKLVRCTKGAIYDVAIDLRTESPTFKRWAGHVLSAESRTTMLYIPEGCAHGFLTLEDETEVFYQISEFYHGELSRGLRWNDPAFNITWPAEVRVISERDRTYPTFEG